MLPQPPTPDEAVQVVKTEIAGGADVIKLFTGSLVERDQVKLMPEPIASAAVSEAHAHDRLVFSHPSNIEGAQVAIDARVDVLAHTTSVRGIWSEQMIAQMMAPAHVARPNSQTVEVRSRESQVRRLRTSCNFKPARRRILPPMQTPADKSYSEPTSAT